MGGPIEVDELRRRGCQNLHNCTAATAGVQSHRLANVIMMIMQIIHRDPCHASQSVSVENRNVPAVANSIIVNWVGVVLGFGVSLIADRKWA